MAKYTEIKGTLDFIRKGYTDSGPTFRFTVADIVAKLDLSEKKAKDVLQTINTRAYFWRGNFAASGDNFIVSTPVYERIKDWFK